MRYFIHCAVLDTMKWTDKHVDILLGEKTCSSRPFQNTPAKQTCVVNYRQRKHANALNNLEQSKFSVSQRSVRDRFRAFAWEIYKEISSSGVQL